MTVDAEQILKDAGLVPAVPELSRNVRDTESIGTRSVPAVPLVPAEKTEGESDTGRALASDTPLAARLRALGCPIALEVDGVPVCWIVADDTDAAARSDLSPCITAAEAGVLAGLDAAGIHYMLELKRRLGGKIEST